MSAPPISRAPVDGGAPRADPGASLLGPALLLTGGRALAFAAAFLVPVVLARVLSQAEFGAYKQIFLLFSTLYYSAQLGAATSLFYFVPRTPGAAARYTGNSVAVLGLAGATAAAALVAGRDAVAWMFGGPQLGPFLFELGAYLLLTLIAAPLEIVLISRGRIRGATWAYALSDVARAAFIVVPALVWGGIGPVMTGAVLFAAARALVALVWLRRELGAGLAADRSALPEQLAYALPFGLAVLVATLQAHAHQLFVSHAFDAATFAIYAVGCLQIPLVDFLATPTGDVMMVRMTEALRDGRRDAALATWNDAVASLALLLVPLAAVLMVVADELIPLLFTDAYAASVPIFRLWTVSILLAPLMTDGALRVFAATRLLLALGVAQLVLVVALVYPLLGFFGLRGAVLVTLLALALAKGVGLWRLAGRLGVGTPQVLPWRRLVGIAAATALAAAAAITAEALLDLPRLAAIAADGVVLGGVYAGLVIAWGLVPPRELAALRARFGEAGVRRRTRRTAATTDGTGAAVAPRPEAG
jgi:O-antigen/teichoic acid export membrane protein